MRVISGIARSVVLSAPKGTATRPTADRLKENLFNILGHRTGGARFLDLFSGSGAIAIEALSRGASEAVLVEYAPQALKTIFENLQRSKLAGQAKVLPLKTERAVPLLRRDNKLFDIIFMDPPYEAGYITKTVNQLAENNVLAKQGLLVIEMPAREAEPVVMAFALIKEKIYGDTKFLLYENEMESDK
jgi:16S rRNA (guanine(966)-N(2))-methyltransferase RsmD